MGVCGDGGILDGWVLASCCQEACFCLILLFLLTLVTRTPQSCAGSTGVGARGVGTNSKESSEGVLLFLNDIVTSTVACPNTQDAGFGSRFRRASRYRFLFQTIGISSGVLFQGRTHESAGSRLGTVGALESRGPRLFINKETRNDHRASRPTRR